MGIRASWTGVNTRSNRTQDKELSGALRVKGRGIRPLLSLSKSVATGSHLQSSDHDRPNLNLIGIGKSDCIHFSARRHETPFLLKPGRDMFSLVNALPLDISFHSFTTPPYP
ncbi:hypothetical protein FRC03_003194 [Tulasnella sp. 419]|nr:hypothetical protein FRC03_003194 [Tulasnella sp. 419]